MRSMVSIGNEGRPPLLPVPLGANGPIKPTCRPIKAQRAGLCRPSIATLKPDIKITLNIAATVTAPILSDKSFYDDEGEYSDEALLQFVHKQSAYIDRYRTILADYFGRRPIRILELGAGTCALSLSLSQSLVVQQSVMFDISAIRMQRYAPRVCKILGLPLPPFQYLEGDFSDPSCFPAEEFDLILFDASLHHARSIWDLLSACKAHLAPSGLMVAQREQYLARLSAGWVLNRLIRTDEVRSGVSENAYLRGQYLYYLRACGFDACAIAAPETMLQKLMFFLNDLVFSKWVLVARSSGKRIGNELPLNSIIGRL